MTFTASSSPEFNAIELAWSKLKAWMRAAKARCRVSRDDAIKAAMEAITTADAYGWFEHCGYQAALKRSALSAPFLHDGVQSATASLSPKIQSINPLVTT